MRDSVPSASYSSVCNVLRQWNILLIPTYRVYRLYDIYIIHNYISGCMSCRKCSKCFYIRVSKYLPNVIFLIYAMHAKNSTKNATALGEQRRVLQRWFCIAEIH